jgi:hypothetical protein
MMGVGLGLVLALEQDLVKGWGLAKALASE